MLRAAAAESHKREPLAVRRCGPMVPAAWVGPGGDAEWQGAASLFLPVL